MIAFMIYCMHCSCTIVLIIRSINTVAADKQAIFRREHDRVQPTAHLLPLFYPKRAIDGLLVRKFRTARTLNNLNLHTVSQSKKITIIHLTKNMYMIALIDWVGRGVSTMRLSRALSLPAMAIIPAPYLEWSLTVIWTPKSTLRRP